MQTGQAPSVLIADDHGIVRDGLRLLLADLLTGVTIIEASDMATLFGAALTRCDLAIIDLNMPGMQGGRQLRRFADQHQELPILVISAMDSPDVASQFLQLWQVHAFISKGIEAARMGHAILAALRGERSGALLLEPNGTGVACGVDDDAPLPPRLRQVRELLRQGLSNKRIARELGISEGTVKNYLSELYRLMNVSNRTEAAIGQNGVLRP